MHKTTCTGIILSSVAAAKMIAPYILYLKALFDEKIRKYNSNREDLPRNIDGPRSISPAKVTCMQCVSPGSHGCFSESYLRPLRGDHSKRYIPCVAGKWSYCDLVKQRA